MRRIITLVAAALLLGAGSMQTKAQGENDVNIGKQNIKLASDLMTPEALWAMGRIGSYAASPDGSKIVYQVGYYSVKHNKSHHVLYVMNSDGSGQQKLTTGSKNETDPQWLSDGRIAFITGGEVWAMNADGSGRKQLSKTGGEVEGFKFSPDGQKVILLKSIPYNDIIQKNPDDLPKATGRLVTDLMYRHWDHYVESIQHPFVARVTADGIGEAKDMLRGLPFECPMEPFGGMEQLDWSPDSKKIAYTCRQPINAKENLKYNVGYDQNPKFSPDGRYVAWLSMERCGYEADRQRLCCYDLQTGEKTYLTESFDSNVDDFCWSDNPKDALIYYIGVWHATENLYAVTLDNKKLTARVTQLTNDCADWGSLQLLNNGRQLLMERHSYTEPADLYVVTPNTKKPEKTLCQQITMTRAG